MLDQDGDLINAIEGDNSPPLIVAVGAARDRKNQSSIELCKFLVERGADVNNRFHFGGSPLEGALNVAM